MQFQGHHFRDCSSRVLYVCQVPAEKFLDDDKKCPSILKVALGGSKEGL